MYLNNLKQDNSKEGFFKCKNNFSFFEIKKEDTKQNIQDKILKCLDVTIKNKDIITR